MRNNATFIDKHQLKLLGELDTWIYNTTWKTTKEQDIANEVRTLITVIENRGHYWESEADLLNELREQFVQYKNNQRYE
jgi:hypothetical protein